MKKRSFDEMIAYFNRRVSEMDIDQDYKMELLGMVTAIGYKHEQTAQQWIPVSERFPEPYIGEWLCCTEDGDIEILTYDTPGDGYKELCFHVWCDDGYFIHTPKVTAWMPLPEPYREEGENR